MTDIFADWKGKRFWVDDIGYSKQNLVVLTDIVYWGENYELLEQWCVEHGCRAQGMTVEIPDKHTLTAFILRWT